jgi:hypothetical protein
MRCRVCFPAGAGAGAVARKRAAGIGARMHDASRSLSLMSERETSDTSLSRFFSVRPTARVLPASECVCLVPRSFLLDGLSLTVRSEKSHLFHYEKGTKQRKVSLYPFPFFSSSGAAHLYTAISKLYGTATPSCDAWRHASVVAGAVGASQPARPACLPRQARAEQDLWNRHPAPQPHARAALRSYGLGSNGPSAAVVDCPPLLIRLSFCIELVGACNLICY